MKLIWSGTDAGVDEAGRGPLAGPVYAAAVMLDADTAIAGLTDSKLLSSTRREQLEVEIKGRARAWALGRADVEEIDRMNILQASLLAMRRAVLALPVVPDCAWIDGKHCPNLPLRVRCLVQGDRLFAPISAASILAKVARDREMLMLDSEFPHYGFKVHKGYPTRAHIQALHTHGACAVHRQSFKPIRDLSTRT